MKPKLAKHSYQTRDDRAWIACSECNEGGNGSAPQKCSQGWNVKRGGKLGCFSGTLLVTLTLQPSSGPRRTSCR